jgi:nucleotide-binding universal stress UspA family protein
MKKILVLTDLSANSRAGIVFAIQLALRTKRTLVFLHVTELLKPRRWSDQKYQDYLERELKRSHKLMLGYIETGFKKIKGPKPRYECIVKKGSHVANTAMSYAEKTKAVAICLTTRGAGLFKRIIGTNAARIIEKSKTPVFVIPVNYEKAPLKEIFYATDLVNFKAEMKRVQRVADLTNARITAYHYDYFINLASKLKNVKQYMKQLSSRGHKFRIRELEPHLALSTQILGDIEESNASLAVIFTDQNKKWFQKLISNSTELSYSIKKPLLVFEK